MERCPCCNARMNSSTHCPRCLADLNTLFASENYADHWLSMAIHYWAETKTEESLKALSFSLQLKKSKLATVFRHYIIHQQCNKVLEMLANKQWLEAKQQFYTIRLLVPHSNQLQQLNKFTDYLLARNQEQSGLFL